MSHCCSGCCQATTTCCQAATTCCQATITCCLFLSRILPIHQPYLHPIHASHITCMKVMPSCSQHLFEKLLSVAESQSSESYSTMVSVRVGRQHLSHVTWPACDVMSPDGHVVLCDLFAGIASCPQEWPAMGGFVKEVPPKIYDILISGFDTCTAPHTAARPIVGSCRWL